MESMKLINVSGTDRELDMIDYSVYKRLKDTVYDAITESWDGTKSVYDRARRRNFKIKLDAITTTDLATLKKFNTDRQELWFESNVGLNTIVYNPFEGARAPLVGGASGFARSGIATYTNESGIIAEVATGIPRFEACKLGNGILLEPARTNYIYPSHGTAADQIWSVGIGTPVITWDANMLSNVDGAGGAVRVVGALNDIVNVNVPGLSISDIISTYVWVKGRGQIRLSVVNVTGTPTQIDLQLTMEWQRLSLETLTCTAGTISLEITCLENDVFCWLSAHQVEKGHTYSSYIPTTVATVTRAMDQLYYITALNPIEGSIAFWCKYPRFVTGCDRRYLWYLNNDMFGRFNDNGDVIFKLKDTPALSIGSSISKNPGDLMHLAFVWKEDYAAIILDGVQLDSTATNYRTTASMATFYLYWPSVNQNPFTVIDDLRIDRRYVEWRISESGLYPRYTDAGNIELMKLTQGRKFRIMGGTFAPRGAQPNLFDGTFALAESSSEENHTIEEI